MKTAPSVAPFIRLFGRYLRDQGLPVTSQREVVAEVVFTTEGHLSVDDLEHEPPEAGRAHREGTIYRTLDLLVRSKLVEEHDFEEGFKRYEHRLSREPVHAHLVCTETGDILEFRSPEVQQIIDEVAREQRIPPHPPQAGDLRPLPSGPGGGCHGAERGTDLPHRDGLILDLPGAPVTPDSSGHSTPLPASQIPLWGRALDRAAGSPPASTAIWSVSSFDGPLTFDLWLEAIQQARRFIHFENYILRDDVVGRRFPERSHIGSPRKDPRRGVEVRVL